MGFLNDLCTKAFPRSLWVYHANSGGCNGCDIEVLNVLTPYYDAERFGIKLVGTPRHADVLLVTGPVNRQMADRVRRIYEQTPSPKAILICGNCGATLTQPAQPTQPPVVLVASNQVIGETYVALQHHYGVTKSEARRALAPFHKICTPMQTNRNVHSRRITLMAVAPKIRASRSAYP